MANKLELTWYGKEDKISVEPRLLIENKELSNTEHDENTENILIHGDNLLALKALEKKYSGWVPVCIGSEIINLNQSVIWQEKGFCKFPEVEPFIFSEMPLIVQ